ncbi:MAG: hypothetical protein AAF989_15705 [Planctomycetota bacterium]
MLEPKSDPAEGCGVESLQPNDAKMINKQARVPQPPSELALTANLLITWDRVELEGASDRSEGIDDVMDGVPCGLWR